MHGNVIREERANRHHLVRAGPPSVRQRSRSTAPQSHSLEEPIMNHQVHHFDMGLWLLFLAYIVSVTGSVVGLACTRCGATATSGRDRLRWLLMASIAIGGVGIWLMHFIAMLGFAIPSSMVRYNLGWTVASAVIAIAAVFVGLITIGRDFDLRRLLAGGVITGLAVAVMHYTGMWAVQMQGTMTYDTTLVVLSFVIAVVAATAALWFTLVLESRGLRFVGRPGDGCRRRRHALHRHGRGAGERRPHDAGSRWARSVLVPVPGLRDRPARTRRPDHRRDAGTRSRRRGEAAAEPRPVRGDGRAAPLDAAPFTRRADAKVPVFHRFRAHPRLLAGAGDQFVDLVDRRRSPSTTPMSNTC